jgi:O-antigen biosynthesis protein
MGFSYNASRRAHRLVSGRLNVPTTPSSSEAPDAETLDRMRRRRAYQAWLLARLPTAAELTRQRLAVRRWSNPPLISIVTPVYATPPEILRRMIRSVQHQSYPHWELCLVDDGSPSSWNADMVTRLAAGDPRIRFTRRPHNGGIVAASNDALAMATGEFVALLDHDDELDPRALFAVAREIVARRDVDVIYTDFDVVDAEGLPVVPFLAPDWSPELLLGIPYIVHLTVYRRSLVAQVGGFRPEFEGSQDYDLILRLTRQTDRIVHVPRVLYHWRAWSRSAAANPEAKPWAYAAGIRAIGDHLAHRRFGGRREPGPELGLHAARFQIEGAPLVSVIVTRRAETEDGDGSHMIRRVAALARRTTYAPCEYVLTGTRDEMEAARLAWLARDKGQARDEWRMVGGAAAPEVRFAAYDGLAADPALAANAGAAAARGEYLLFLDAALDPLREDWLSALLELSQQPGIGAVGGQLVDQSGGLWHGGIVITGGEPRLVTREDYRLIRNLSAVSGACLMTPRAVFDAAEGFSPAGQAGYSDVDYCLRLRERGARIVFTPHACLQFAAAPPQTAAAPAHQEAFRARWQARTQADPYYNPNFRQDAARFEIEDV